MCVCSCMIVYFVIYVLCCVCFVVCVYVCCVCVRACVLVCVRVCMCAVVVNFCLLKCPLKSFGIYIKNTIIYICTCIQMSGVTTVLL